MTEEDDLKRELKTEITELVLDLIVLACTIAGTVFGAIVTHGILKSINASTKLWVFWILSMIMIAFLLIFSTLSGFNKGFNK